MTRSAIGIGLFVALMACAGPLPPLTTSGPPQTPSGTDTASGAPTAPPAGTGTTPGTPSAVTPGWTGIFRGADGEFNLRLGEDNQVSGTHTRTTSNGQRETVDVLGRAGTNPDGTQYASLNYLSGAVTLVTLTTGGTVLRADGKEYTKS